MGEELSEEERKLIEFAAKMVTLNMVVFWGAVFALFWMCQRGQQPVMGEEYFEEKVPALAPSSSQEASS